MSTVLEERVENIARQLQSWCDDLNAIARKVQLCECSEEEAAEEALPIFEAVLERAQELSASQAKALFGHFECRIVPSVFRAWAPWIEEAWPQAKDSPPIIVWIARC